MYKRIKFRTSRAHEHRLTTYYLSGVIGFRRRKKNVRVRATAGREAARETKNNSAIREKNISCRRSAHSGKPSFYAAVQILPHAIILIETCTPRDRWRRQRCGSLCTVYITRKSSSRGCVQSAAAMAKF